jgi:hypothetical protein
MKPRDSRTTAMAVRSVSVLLISALLFGCSTPSGYQSNVKKTTGANAVYLQNNDFKIVDINEKTGFIEAINKTKSISVNNKYFNYNTTPNIKYEAVNSYIITDTHGYSISSVTAYLTD